MSAVAAVAGKADLSLHQWDSCGVQPSHISSVAHVQVLY
jgi:hypothetical protein